MKKIVAPGHKLKLMIRKEEWLQELAIQLPFLLIVYACPGEKMRLPTDENIRKLFIETSQATVLMPYPHLASASFFQGGNDLKNRIIEISH